MESWCWYTRRKPLIDEALRTALGRLVDFNHHGVVHPNVTTLSSSPSCQVRSPDILFPPNALWQQERGLKEDEAEDPDNPDAWMGSFDDEDASRDTTKKARQLLYLIQRFSKYGSSVEVTSFALRCVDFFISFARISLGPPEERRRPPHASGKRRSPPRARGESITRRCLVRTIANRPSTDFGPAHDRDQGPVQSWPPPASASPNVEMHAVYPNHEDPVQVCPSLYPSACMHSRSSSFVPPCTVAHRKHLSFSLAL
ncbi:hypothetical protein V8E53_009928 [Lactarius tabidus]